jgi:nanoRNase/pAp phosphatase (c-di-AMP/oligoRNAs hydrolase)
VGSAAALASLLRQKSGIESQIYAEGLNRSATNVLNAFNLVIAPPENLSQHAIIVLVDLNNLEQMGNLAKNLPQVEFTTFCIDHHVPHKDLPDLVDYLLYDEEVRSTAELVLQVWEASDQKLASDDATLLATGLVYDSRHFHIALNKTFEHFNLLLQYGADYEKVLSLLFTPLDKSERMARLKASKRAIVYDEYNLLIVVTTIRSYEASACRALISIGADIAIACAVKKDEVRVSARATSSVIRDWGLDLAKDVMEPLGELIGGAGGGHPSAAGANGVAGSDHALGLALQLLRKALKAHANPSKQPGSSSSVGE